MAPPSSGVPRILCAMRSPILRTLVAAVVGTLLLAACSKTPAPTYAAIVDGSTITKAQVGAIEPAIRLLVQKSGQTCASVQSGAPQTAPQAPPSPGADDNCSQLVLTQLIQAQLLKQWAADHKVVASASDVNAFMNQIETQFGGQRDFEAAAAKEGVTLTAMGAVGRLIAFEQNVQAAYTKQSTSDAALQKAYDASKSQFTTIDTAHILVKDLATAQKIKDEATTANFAELAKKYSTDPGSKDKGGALGPVPASQLVAEYSNAVLAAKPGQIIGPVQSQFGYHVIWVKSIDTQPFDKVKSQLLQSVGQQAFNTWLKGLMDDASIKVNPVFGRLDKATGHVVSVDSTEASPTPAAPVAVSP